MASLDELSSSQFNVWVRFGHIWTILVTIFVVFVPPVQEVYMVYQQWKQNTKRADEIKSIPEEKGNMSTSSRNVEGKRFVVESNV